MMDTSTKPVVASRGITSAISCSVPLQLLVLIVLLAAAAVSQAVGLSAFASPDVWRHLSVGTWILDNYSVPRNILFSQSGNLPWTDASWLFDALTGVTVKFLGLRGLPFLAMMFACVTAIAVFVLARGARRGLWSGAVLTAIAAYLLAGLPLKFRQRLGQ